MCSLGHKLKNKIVTMSDICHGMIVTLSDTYCSGNIFGVDGLTNAELLYSESVKEFQVTDHEFEYAGKYVG